MKYSHQFQNSIADLKHQIWAVEKQNEQVNRKKPFEVGRKKEMGIWRFNHKFQNSIAEFKHQICAVYDGKIDWTSSWKKQLEVGRKQEMGIWRFNF